MLAVIPFLISASYVGSWLGVSWMSGRGLLPGKWHYWTHRTLFRPVEFWTQSGFPGGDTLKAWGGWAYSDGRLVRMTESEAQRRASRTPTNTPSATD